MNKRRLNDHFLTYKAQVMTKGQETHLLSAQIHHKFIVLR